MRFPQRTRGLRDWEHLHNFSSRSIYLVLTLQSPPSLFPTTIRGEVFGSPESEHTYKFWQSYINVRALESTLVKVNEVVYVKLTPSIQRNNL